MQSNGVPNIQVLPLLLEALGLLMQVPMLMFINQSQATMFLCGVF